MVHDLDAVHRADSHTGDAHVVTGGQALHVREDRLVGIRRAVARVRDRGAEHVREEGGDHQEDHQLDERCEQASHLIVTTCPRNDGATSNVAIPGTLFGVVFSAVAITVLTVAVSAAVPIACWSRPLTLFFAAQLSAVRYAPSYKQRYGPGTTNGTGGFGRPKQTGPTPVMLNGSLPGWYAP